MCATPSVLPTASTAEDFKVLKGSRQTQRDLPQRRRQYQDRRMGKDLSVLSDGEGVFSDAQKALDSLNPEKIESWSLYSQREEIMNSCKQCFYCFKSTENSKAE